METTLQLGLIIVGGVGLLYPAAGLVRRGRSVAAMIVATLAAALIGLAAHALGRSSHREVGDSIAAALTITDETAKAGDLPGVRRILDFGIRSLASPGQPLEKSSRALWQYAIDENTKNGN